MMGADNQLSFVKAIVNASTRSMQSLFPGMWSESKHNHYKDYGWPTTITGQQFYDMYQRNGLARAAIEKTRSKTWQDNPELLQSEDAEESPIEAEIRQKFEDIRLWQSLSEADARSMVGGWSGIILRIADSQLFDQPVQPVGNGLEALVEVIPFWCLQMSVADWDLDQTSLTYGQPKMYQFNESVLGTTGQASGQSAQGRQRQFRVHPDRVLIWSKDGTIFSESILSPGFNDLMTMEKVSGAGGEGFWKNAKSSPVLNMDKEATLNDIARAMGVSPSEVADAMDDKVADWQRGFDKLLMLQGMEAKTLSISLPDPANFFGIALNAFCASIQIPAKILVGSQTGERASLEDAREWSQTNKARRVNQAIPSIKTLIKKLEGFRILPTLDWVLHWEDLTGSTLEEEVSLVEKMAGVNQKMSMTKELVFLPEELRETMGLDPLSPEQMQYDGYPEQGLDAKGNPTEVEPPATEKGGNDDEKPKQ